MRNFLQLSVLAASVTLPFAAFAASEPHLVVNELAYDDNNRTLAMTICNDGDRRYAVDEFGPISYAITIDHKTDHHASLRTDIDVDTCETFTTDNPFSAFSGWGGIPQGQYKLSIALEVPPADHEPVHTDVAIWMPIPPAADLQFSDFDQTYKYADAIYYLRAHGMVSGYADNSFRPESTINRSEFVKVMVESFYPSTDCSLEQNQFRDVANGQWFAVHVCVAAANGWIQGYPDKTFAAANTINFVEAAKILAKAFQLEARTTIPACDGDCPWYRSYVLMLETKGVIPNSITSFDQPITRGEMAEMIYRLRIGSNDKPSQTYEFLSFMQYCREWLAAGGKNCE